MASRAYGQDMTSPAHGKPRQWQANGQTSPWLDHGNPSPWIAELMTSPPCGQAILWSANPWLGHGQSSPRPAQPMDKTAHGKSNFSPWPGRPLPDQHMCRAAHGQVSAWPTQPIDSPDHGEHRPRLDKSTARAVENRSHVKPMTITANVLPKPWLANGHTNPSLWRAL
jgi:hypothetical protein